MKTLLGTSFLSLTLIIAQAERIDLDEQGWPRGLNFKNGGITIYQPQIESFEKNKIEARAALAVKMKDKSPVFGAMWFSSRAITDRDQHLMILDEIVVESLKFPEGDDEVVEKLRKAMTEKLTGLSLSMSMERFTASIEHLSEHGDSDENFNNAPPKIYFETTPAVLVFIDGEPILKEIENSSYKYVMNTPFFLVQNPSNKQYYLKGGEWWYNSKDVLKGWNLIENPPADVVKLAEQAFQSEPTDMDSMIMQMDHAPKVIVSTEPAASEIRVSGRPLDHHLQAPGQQIHPQPTGPQPGRPNRPPERIMYIPTEMETYTKEIIAATGNKEAMVSGATNHVSLLHRKT